MTSFVFLIALTSVNSQPADDGPSKAGLVLWLDATDVDGDGDPLNQPISGQSVDRWLDKSDRDNHVQQANEKRQPTFQQNAFGESPGIRFRGHDFLSLDTLSGLATGDQPFHAIVVMKAHDSSSHGSQRILDLNSREADSDKSENRRGFWVGYQNHRGKVRLGIHNGDEGEGITKAWNDQPNLIETVYSGEQLFAIYVNGRRDQRGVFNGTHFLGFRENVTLAIGQHYGMESNQSTFFDGAIAEVLIYDRPLSATQRREIGSYLSGKYSLQTDFRPIPQFEEQVRPILADHCYSCHGEDTQEAELDLRSVSAMLHGGRAGPVIVRGFPDRSEMISMIEAKKMPPPGEEPLSADEIRVLREWIDADAPTKEKIVATARNTISRRDRDHWAYRMLVRHKPPKVRHTALVRNGVDRFVLSKLEANQLTMSSMADRSTLVRRAFFDLIGLPPTPDEIDLFLNDKNPAAYERLLTRLFNSPHFGERWGRYWLDVAGYVDVYGSDNDAAIIKPLEGKWRYRDYVVRSFNADKPFDQFLVEQLAGDELYEWQNADRFTTEMRDSLVATGFLLCANDDSDQNELNTPDIRHHVLQRTSEVIGSNLFALTFECAKCHDHKYEAISQIDYYQLQSVFAAAFNVRHWIVSTGHGRADVSNALKADIDLHNRNIDNQAEELKKRGSKEDADLQKQIAELVAGKRKYETIQVVYEPNTPPPTFVLRRGNYLRPGLEVQPGLPAIFGSLAFQPAKARHSSGRRWALARQVTDPESLVGQHVARVFVNRIWQQVFGRGIVTTSSNFGVSGALPSHPELLDWLTLRFIESGWRVKPLIRLMMMSATYRQQASVESDAVSAKGKDPENKLLWRMNLRRLDSEYVRDAIMTTSGRLDRSLYGEPVPLDVRPDGMVVVKQDGLPTPTTQWRRSLYILARRNYHLTMLRLFDQPMVTRSCTVRQPSTVVTQSLALLHDDFVLEHSQYFADRVIDETGNGGNEPAIVHAFRCALGRHPTTDEVRWSTVLLDRQFDRFRSKQTETKARRSAMAQFCKMLFNANEFLYIK